MYWNVPLILVLLPPVLVDVSHDPRVLPDGSQGVGGAGTDKVRLIAAEERILGVA